MSEAAFTQALLGYKWSWDNGVNFRNATFQLYAGGFMKWTNGSFVEIDTWRITGRRTIHIDYVDGKFADITFDDDVKSYKGLNWHKDRLRGVRLEAVGNSENAASAAPLASIRTDANQPRIGVIKDQGPNATEWALTPLDEAIPADIRQNLTFLREDLLDEGKKAAKASPEAYKLASDYCDKILTALDQRDLARVNAGYRASQADADKRTSTQALDARRNHQMSWPQYAREESQRAALRENETDKADVKKERLKVDWATRSVRMRSYLDDLYRQLREAMR